MNKLSRALLVSLAFPLLVLLPACEDSIQAKRKPSAKTSATQPPEEEPVAEEAKPPEKEPPPATETKKPAPTPDPKTTPPGKGSAAPNITVELSKVVIDWKDRQQLFTLTCTNHGDKEETFKAIIYAKNDSVRPPLRAVSPPTAYDWFELARSKDGQLTRKDVEDNWTAKGFVSARGSKLLNAWSAILKPGETRALDCSHDLYKTSPHPLWKDRPLPQAAYTEYHLWLFTPQGQCYLEQDIYLQGTKPIKSQVKKLPIEPPEKGKPLVEKPRPPVVVEKDKPKPPVVVSEKDQPKPEPPKPDPVAEEQAAAARLRTAKSLLNDGRFTQGNEQLRALIKAHPSTKAADEARRLLKE